MHDKKTMKGFWAPAQHNGMIFEMWKEKGEDMPFALACGVPPVCAWQGASRILDYVDEYKIGKITGNQELVEAGIDLLREGFDINRNAGLAFRKLYSVLGMENRRRDLLEVTRQFAQYKKNLSDPLVQNILGVPSPGGSPY